MPHELDDTDVAIIKSLYQDGRKSFRTISKELSISTPTIKARYQRLVNLGLIKSISPILDVKKLDKKFQEKLSETPLQKKSSSSKIKKGLAVKVGCDYCEGEVSSKPQVLKFGNQERFFCCTSCRSLYKEKYAGRINSILDKEK